MNRLLNMEALERSIVLAIAAEFHAGRKDSPRAIRLRKLKGSVVKHHHWVKAKQKLRDRYSDLEGDLKIARAMIDAGGTLVAIDVERSRIGWKVNTARGAMERASEAYQQHMSFMFRQYAHVEEPFMFDILNTCLEEAKGIFKNVAFLNHTGRVLASLGDRAEHSGMTTAMLKALKEEFFVYPDDEHRIRSTPTFFVVRHRSAGVWVVGRLADTLEETNEVGISTYSKAKGHETRNLIVSGRWPRKVPFFFGESEFVTVEEIGKILESVHNADETVAVVGHSVYLDMGHIHRNITHHLKKKTWLDTGNYADSLFHLGQITDATLGGMLTHYEIDHQHLHCGGNDARYNMELLVKMIGA